MKKKSDNLTLPVLDKEAKTSGEKSVASEIFGLKTSPVLVAGVVRALLGNSRRAKAKTKTRAEVVGSKAKIWRQKGTGRARHGDRQAPIFVGGGVAHGPRGVENYKTKINKKMTKKAIYVVLSDKAREKRVLLVNQLEFKKTKEAASFLNKVKKEFAVSGKIGVIYSKDEAIKRYLKNVGDVLLFEVGSLNVYSLCLADCLLITSGGLSGLEREKQNVSN